MLPLLDGAELYLLPVALWAEKVEVIFKGKVASYKTERKSLP